MMPTTISEQIRSLNVWLYRIPLRRRNPYLNDDFTDGVLVAQVIHHYSKTLVSVLDIQRLENNLQMGWDKRMNWLELDPVFAALNIQIYEPCLQGIMLNLPGYAEQLLTVLRVQLDRYIFNILLLQQPWKASPPELSSVRQNVSPISGCASSPATPNRLVGDTPVLRLSNVDYHTQKSHVIAFFRAWGGPIDPSRIHVPISLDTGKMVYEVYVTFDTTKRAMGAMYSVLAASAAATGGPPQLLNRRISLRLVTHDELYVAFFGRTHRQIDETTEFLTEPNKEKMLKLCRSYKNWFNSHTPARPFEFIISFIELLPWHEASFAKEQRNRSFELLRLSIFTLLTHQSSRGCFPPDLMTRMVEVARYFTEQQLASLTNCLKAREQDTQRHPWIKGSAAESGLRRKLMDNVPFEFATGSLMVDELPMVHAGLRRMCVLQHIQGLPSADGLQEQLTENLCCRSYAARQHGYKHDPLPVQRSSYSETMGQGQSDFFMTACPHHNIAVNVGKSSGVEIQRSGIGRLVGGGGQLLRAANIGGADGRSTLIAFPAMSHALSLPPQAISAIVSALDQLQLDKSCRFPSLPIAEKLDATDIGRTIADN